MNQNAVIEALGNGAFDHCLTAMYACKQEELSPYRERIADAVRAFGKEFGSDGDIMLFSAPGRTELCGNHTDHQGGHVLASAVTRDIIGVARRNDSGSIRLKSEGMPMNCITLADLSPLSEEKGSAASLLRGIAARFAWLGFPVTGFDAYTVSDVPRGSGLSSSAAFEVLVGNICNGLFADGSIDPLQIAQIGQYAENVYFGKPCGLMDQTASAVGGVIAIDFSRRTPAYTRADVDLAAEGYALCILDSGASHSGLTEAYAAVPAEMRAVAEVLGHPVLSQVKKSDVLAAMPEIRQRCGDRAFLRALHYFGDDERVQRAVRSLRNGYFAQYLEEIRASGRSSFQYLQNAALYSDPCHEEVAVTIALCEELLGGRGAVRVHGGGFAGTVQAYVPLDMLEEFCRKTDTILGAGRCRVLRLRPVGGLQLTPDA